MTYTTGYCDHPQTVTTYQQGAIMQFQSCGLQLLRWLLLALNQELVGQDGRSVKRWDRFLHGSASRDTTTNFSRCILRAGVPPDQPA